MLEEEMVHETSTKDYGPMVDDHQILNAFRYLLMRIIRLIATMVCEVGMLCGVFGLALSLFMIFGWIISGFKSDYYLDPGRTATWFGWLWAGHPVIASGVFLMLTVLFMGISWSFGLPYRWKSTMPGAGLIHCERCHKEIADDWKCSECGLDRIEMRLPTWLLEKANVAVTCLWALHDCTIGLVSMVL